MSWRARKGLWPRPSTKAWSCAAGRPSRFTRDEEGSGTGSSVPGVQLRGAEEERDLLRGRLRRIRAMHHVALDALGEVGADRAGRGLLRIRGAHDLAVLRDGALA